MVSKNKVIIHKLVIKNYFDLAALKFLLTTTLIGDSIPVYLILKDSSRPWSFLMKQENKEIEDQKNANTSDLKDFATPPTPY